MVCLFKGDGNFFVHAFPTSAVGKRRRRFRNGLAILLTCPLGLAPPSGHLCAFFDWAVFVR